MLFPWLALGWAALVAGAWVMHHLLWLKETWPTSLWLFLAGGIGLSLALIWLCRPKQSGILTLSWGKMLGGIFLLTLFVFNIAGFAPPLSRAAAPILPLGEWWPANATFSIQLLALAAVFGITLLTLLATGQGLIRLFGIRSLGALPSLLTWLITVAIGLAGWVYIALLLSAAGWLRGPVIIGIAVLILAIGRSGWRTLVAAWSRPLGIALPLSWQYTVATAFLAFFIASSCIDSLRPIPSGYDDMTAYMNRAQLIAERGALVPGGFPFPFEILAATLGNAAPGPGFLFGMSLGTLALFLAALALWGMGRDLFGGQSALFAVALWLSLPQTSALVFREVKPDPLLAFALLLTTWVSLHAIRSRSLAYLPLIALLFGLAISIKLTALFFVGPLLVGALALGWRRWKEEPRLGRLLGRALIAGILPLLPWLALGLGTRQSDIPLSPNALISSIHPASVADAAIWRKLGLDFVTDCQTTGREEDSARFMPDRLPVLRSLLTPWDLTMNHEPALPATEIGFLFLAFLPWLLLRLAPASTGAAHASVRLLAGMTASYFLLWLAFGYPVLWYAYPGFALLCLLVARIVSRGAPSRFERRFLWALLILGLAGNTLLRFTYSLNAPTLSFAAGRIDTPAYIMALFPGFPPVLDIVNADRGARLLIAGSGIRYFITDSDRRVVTDQYLDIFTCLNREQDRTRTLARLGAFHIRFLCISADTLAQAEDASPPSLRDKVRWFRAFAETALIPLMRTRVGILYAVP